MRRILYPRLRDPQWLYLRYCDEGRSIREIALEVGCSDAAVHGALDDCFIARDDIAAEPSPRPFRELHDPRWLRHRYETQRLRPSVIARVVGCRESSVRNALAHHRIPLRPADAAAADDAADAVPSAG